MNRQPRHPPLGKPFGWMDLACRIDLGCSLLDRAKAELQAVRSSGDGAVAESG